MTKPSVLVLRAAGTNCDAETAHAFERAGAAAARVHVNELLAAPARLDEFQLLAIPGGFSYGDDIAAGRILALQLRQKLGDALRRFVDRGGPVIGICNGFQVLLKTDLLPGPAFGPPGTAATLAANQTPRFVDRWVTLEKQSPRCVWTKDMLGPLECPIAHGEGRFVTKDDATLRKLQDAGHVALTYASGPVNGSAGDVAGLTDETGLVLGLMPHPERHIDATQHPAWTRRSDRGDGPGLGLFRSAVAHVG